jgi:hypothetical protein
MLDSYSLNLRIYLKLSILRSKGVLFLGLSIPPGRDRPSPRPETGLGEGPAPNKFSFWAGIGR